MGCCGWRSSRPTPTEVAARPVPDDDTILGQRLSRSEADLTAMSGGRSLCRIGDGPDVGSAKYAEGRWAALREVKQRLRRSAGTPVGDATADVLDAWEAARRAAAAQGPAWAAYRAGGVAELRGLLEDLVRSQRTSGV